MLQVSVSKQRGEFFLDAKFAATTPGVIALFGHSGCGKSTLVNLIAGLITPDSGCIQLGEVCLFDGQRGVNIASEKRRIGYVFQEARLFPHLNVLGNLRYGLQRAASATVIELEAVIELLGLRALLQRRVHRLSGGEKQRVAIGRALLSQPQLLLLDEPLASLDAARRDEVLPYLERLRDQLAIPMVYVSHQFEEVLRLATHVVLMDQGKVVAQGDVASISRKPELRALFGPEIIGAVLQGQINAVDNDSGLAQIALGAGQLNIDAQGLQAGQQVRLQLLARDLILATAPPQGLSVRNVLHGTITQLTRDDPPAMLVEVDVGELLLARVTLSAAAELGLRVGLPIWVLVKAVTLRGHVFAVN